MTKLKTLRGRWLRDPEFRAEYEALDEEFALAAALTDACARAHLTQAHVASRPIVTLEPNRDDPG